MRKPFKKSRKSSKQLPNPILLSHLVVSAGNPGTGNSREFPDFLHSRFPGIQGRDPGKKNPRNMPFSSTLWRSNKGFFPGDIFY